MDCVERKLASISIVSGVLSGQPLVCQVQFGRLPAHQLTVSQHLKDEIRFLQPSPMQMEFVSTITPVCMSVWSFLQL